MSEWPGRSYPAAAGQHKPAGLPLEPGDQASMIIATTIRKIAIGRTPMPYTPPARLLGAAVAALLIASVATGVAADLNDYPTAVRADYVFGCMKTNGETRHALEQCSCSIDVVASILPYERYVTAEAVLSMAQIPGERGSMFRTPEPARAALNDLRRAQAEAEVRCF
jgi:hypothetical protein